jgi:chromosome segregation ATPase
MPAKMLFRDAQGRDGAVELRGDPVYIGRAVECAIRTDDAMVSRKHSLIRFDQGRFWIEDLGSSNGTHVNDMKIQRQVLSHNDVVRCGSLWLRYVEDGPIGVPYGSPYGVAAGGFQSQPQQPVAMQQQPPPRPSQVGVAPTAAAGGLEFASTVATPGMAPQSLPPRPGMSPGMSPMAKSGPSSSVVVDLGGEQTGLNQFTSDEVHRLRKEVDDSRAQLEALRGERDKEVAENKRLRAEHANMGQRLEDAKTQLKENEEVIDAHKRVAEELRIELDQLKDDHTRVSSQLTEAQEDLASRSRQLQRAQEDVAKAKSEVELQKKQVAELSKMKDEGFKKMNDQLAEVEHLREVIREQERILEERRVGLISLEEALKELRAEREARIKDMAAVKAERDELRVVENRRNAQLQATEEENRRLARLLSDLEAGGTGGDSGEIMRLSNEVKELRVEAKKIEGERQRVAESLERAEQRAEKAQTDLARLQVEGSSGTEKLKDLEKARQKADEARGKAEVAKQKAEEEREAAKKARDEAMAHADEAVREMERMRSKIAEAESDRPAAEASQKEIRDLKEQLEAAGRRAKALQAEAEQAKAAATAAAGAGGGDGATAALREKAGEVYQSINDVLSELRMNINLAREEFQAIAAAAGPGKEGGDRARTILDAMEAAASQTEDVKGVLRGLRELAEA